jgi:hypothetical protein
MAQRVRDAKRQEREDKQSGSGRMIFRNISASTIILPKPSFDIPPKQQINPGETFTGDSYHQNAMQSTGALRVIAVHSDSNEVRESAKSIELINVFDPKTGKTERLTPEQLADSKKKGGKTSSKGEDQIDAVP